MLYTFFCIVIGETTPFSVDIDETLTVDYLKKAIKKEKEPESSVSAAKASSWTPLPLMR